MQLIWGKHLNYGADPGHSLGVLHATVCVSRSWQHREAAAQEAGKLHCAEVENTCYCADGAVRGLQLGKTALSWVHLELVKLCWHELEESSAEFSPRNFTGNLRGCGRGVFSAKYFVFHALAFSMGVTTNKNIMELVLENSACVCSLILTYWAFNNFF